MIDLVNGIILFAVGLVGGAALHSLWIHAKQRKELEDWNKLEHK